MIIAFSSFLIEFTPFATTRNASISSPESVSSRSANLGSKTAIWKISFLFFSPPENPSLTGLLSSESFRLSNLILSPMRSINSIASISFSPLYFR